MAKQRTVLSALAQGTAPERDLLVALPVWLLVLCLGGCVGPPPRGPVGPPSVLTIENRTSDELCGVHFMQSADERGFGPNRMGKHETIAKGAARRFPLSETSWNLRVKDCLGRTVYQRVALPLGKEPTVVVTEADADALLVGGQKYAH